MAVQEALILPLRASLPSSGFAKVSLSLSLSLCVRVSELPSPLPPLSSPLIDSSFRLPLVRLCLSEPFLLLFLALSALPFSPLSQPSLLVFLAGQDDLKKKKLKKKKNKKGRLLLFITHKKGFCGSLLACLAGCFFFPPLFPPTCLFPRSPSLPSPLPGWGVCGELETLAGRAAENESTKQQNASA